MDPKHWPISVTHHHQFIVGTSCPCTILISHSHQNYRTILIFMNLIDFHSFSMQAIFLIGNTVFGRHGKVFINTGIISWSVGTVLLYSRLVLFFFLIVTQIFYLFHLYSPSLTLLSQNFSTLRNFRV